MPERILIIDDDETEISVLSRVVRSNQYAAQAVSGGAAALQLLRQEKFDLILLDVNMSDMDGFEMLRTLRETDNTPVIIVSSRQEAFDTMYGLDIGEGD